MSPGIRPGARVPVRQNRHHPRGHHPEAEPPLFQRVGLADRIDARYGEHRVIVVFPSIRVPPFGATWCDAFSQSELEPIG